MKKIRVGYFTHHWDTGGTAACLERVIEALDLSQFEPFAFYWPQGNNTRLSILRMFLGNRLIPFYRSHEKGPKEGGYAPIDSDFAEVVKRFEIDILHVARSGYYEWPINQRICPIQIETNVFGYRDESGFCDYSLFISNYVNRIHENVEGRCGIEHFSNYNKKGATVYIPISAPTQNKSDLRSELGIPSSAVVCGRIGSPANFHPIALYAFKENQRSRPDIYFIIHSPCEETKKFVFNNQIKNVIFLPQTNDIDKLEHFWNTLDIFCHYRSDGECFSAAIAEAMAHSLPIISHISNIYDAHIETIGNGGVVVYTMGRYAIEMRVYIDSEAYRKHIGQQAFNIFNEKYEQSKVVKNIEGIYKELVK